MQKISKEETPKRKVVKEISEDKPEIGEESTWSKDQQERNYYYDDSHGYQEYVPEEDSDENDN